MKRIVCEADLSRWYISPAYSAIVDMLLSVNSALTSKSITKESNYVLDEKLASSINIILSMLSQIESWIDLYPPVTQNQRYGNVAFREWYLHFISNDLHKALFLNLLKEEIENEIRQYWFLSFGNETRIDYGSGHELAFLAWLTALYKCDIFKCGNEKQMNGKLFYAIGSVVFPKYLQVVRRLQMTYFLEPAGSHGVWGLDDYHFIPFIWGSSQLIKNTDGIKPINVIDNKFNPHLSIDEINEKYLFFQYVSYVKFVCLLVM